MRDLLKDKSISELIDMIEQLMLECDTRHAHEDALMAQIRELGEIPIEHTFLDPPLEDFISREPMMEQARQNRLHI